MKTDSAQTNKPFNPTPTLALPLKGRGIAMFLPFQGGGEAPPSRAVIMTLGAAPGLWRRTERDGVSVGIMLNLP